MDLGNLIETVVHHLLIGGMTCLGRRDGFHMVSALVYMMYTSVYDVHWTRPMMNHDARLSIVMIHQATILHGLSTLRGY